MCIPQPIEKVSEANMDEKKFRISGYDVKDVTQESARVGCTIVTRKDAEELLARMSAASVSFVTEGYRSGTGNYIRNSDFTDCRFSLEASVAAYVRTNEVTWGNNKKIELVLRKDLVKELHAFLGAYLEKYPG